MNANTFTFGYEGDNFVETTDRRVLEYHCRREEELTKIPDIDSDDYTQSPTNQRSRSKKSSDKGSITKDSNPYSILRRD